MEHERTDAANDQASRQQDLEKRVDIKFAAWASSVVALLVMAPSVYRVITGTFAGWDLAFIAVGMGLIAFHMIRLARLRREGGHAL